MGTAETKLTNKMRADGKHIYGERLVIVKYHGSAYTRAGTSDLLCCLDGRFIAVEVKAPESYGGSAEKALEQGPTVLQQAFIGHVMAAGGVAAVCATREQFLETLAEADRRNREACLYCYSNEEDGYGQFCTLHPLTELTSI